MSAHAHLAPVSHFPTNGNLTQLISNEPLALVQAKTLLTAGWNLIVRPKQSNINVATKSYLVDGRRLVGIEARGSLDDSYLRTEIEIDPKLWIERRPNILSFYASSLRGASQPPAFASVLVCHRIDGRLNRKVVELASNVPLTEDLREQRIVVDLDHSETLYRAAVKAQKDPSETLWLSFITRSPQVGFRLARVEFVTVTLSESSPFVAPAPAPAPASAPTPAPAASATTEDLERSAREKRLVRRIEQDLLDYEKKLWGGFSQTAIKELRRVIGTNLSHPEARARAAWELARWWANQGDYAECLAMLQAARSHSKVFARRRNFRLVEYFALTRLGAFSETIDAIETARAFNSTDPNFGLSLANVHLAMAEAGLVSRSEADDKRLAEINAIFALNDLLPIYNGEPVEPLTLARLRCDTEGYERDGGPKISVLMAAFNAEEHLDIALGSMLAQTWRNTELIVIDDCSDDGTWARLQDYAARDPRVKAFRNETNMGAYPTRNRALALSTGDYVTVHDSDDWSHPQMLERQIEALLADPKHRFSFSMMTRVTMDLRYGIRPARRNMEIVHRSYPSLMISRKDLDELGVWDAVRANADAELVKRARAHFGDAAMVDAAATSPLSFFLVRPESLTEQSGTGLLSLTFGVRHEYDRQADYMHQKMAANGVAALQHRTDRKSPFACPSGLLPKHLIGDRHFDIILVSDLSLKGGTRSCNLSYIDAAIALGKKVGLFHWPRGDLKLLPDIEAAYRDRNQNPQVEIVTCEEEVSCQLLVLHHPPIMATSLDAVPKIQAKAGYILVNQLPYQMEGQSNVFYEPYLVERDFQRLFGVEPTWLPISPLVRRHLPADVRRSPIAEEDWFPPVLIATRTRGERAQGKPLVIGRHARDHWTKWPQDVENLRAAYCADTDIEVRLLGGATHAIKRLGAVPANWTVLEFDSESIEDYLDGLDALVHFPQENYIEEFGRTVAEAMARSVPCILPHRFQETFGGAALYCEPSEVQALVRRLAEDAAFAQDVAARGLAFVRATCSAEVLGPRLERALAAALSGSGTSSSAPAKAQTKSRWSFASIVGR